MSILGYLSRGLLFLFLTNNLVAQVQPDTIFRPSVVVGMDVSGLARELIEPGTRQWEWSVSGEWSRNWFGTLEGGLLNTSIERQTHNYFANGWFLRAGVDYNLLERDQRNIHDLLLLMLRYGYGNINHESTSIIINNPYWGDYNTFLEPETQHAHWVEFGAGIRARIFADFYMGWSIRTRLMLSRGPQTEMDPYLISGFGKSLNNPNVNIQYSLYYLFPF